MSLLESSLDTIIGFILGFIHAVFIISVSNSIKQNSIDKIGKTFVLFPISIALLVFVYNFARSGGLFVQWQHIGLPNYERAVKIIDIDYVQAQSGNNYHLICLDCQEGQWEQVGAVTKNEDLETISSSRNCGAFSFLPRIRKEFVETKEACVVTFGGLGASKVVYAVDAGGNVYYWRHNGIGEYSEFVPIGTAINSGLISCIIGLITIPILLFANSLKRKFLKQKDSAQSNS